jgi:putative membrane protein insertion efficiency factor
MSFHPFFVCALRKNPRISCSIPAQPCRMRGWASSRPSALRRARSRATRSSASRANCSAPCRCRRRLHRAPGASGQHQGRPGHHAALKALLRAELARLFASQAPRPRKPAARSPSREAAIMKRLLVWLLRATSCCCRRCSGQSCRFYPTCSNYAIEALRLHGAARGGWLALRRVCRCHPWNAGGVDPGAAPHKNSTACGCNHS